MIPSPPPNTVSSNFVRDRIMDGHFGEPVDSNPLDRFVTALNADPQTKEVRTLTLGGGFSAGTLYTASLLGFTISYTSVTGDVDQTGVAASFAAQINADPNLRGQVTATSAAAVITLTANLAGEVFALVSGTLTTAALVTSAAAALDIPFGRMVLLVGLGSVVWSGCDFLAKIADAAGLTAQSDTVQITAFDASSTIIVYVKDEEGHVLSTLVAAHTTDAATTAGLLEAAFDADLGLVEKGITASVSTDTVTVVAGTAGQEFTLEVFTNGVGTHLHTAGGPVLSTSVFKSALGVSVRRMDIPSDTVGDSSDTKYRAGASLDVMTKGKIWVELDTSEAIAPTLGADVFVDTTAGAGAGRFYAAAGSGRFKIPGLTWQSTALQGELGILEVDLA